jgi:hypothetical protein
MGLWNLILVCQNRGCGQSRRGCHRGVYFNAGQHAVKKRDRQIASIHIPVALTVNRSKQHKENRVAGEIPTPRPFQNNIP